MVNTEGELMEFCIYEWEEGRKRRYNIVIYVLEESSSPQSNLDSDADKTAVIEFLKTTVPGIDL